MVLIYLVFNGLNQDCFAKNINNSQEIVLSRTENYFSGKTLDAYQAFLFEQVTMLTGRKITYSLMPRIKQNKDKYPVNLEYYLWSIRKQNLPTLKAVTLPKDPNFDKTKSATLLNEDSQFVDKYNAHALEVFRVFGKTVACERGNNIVNLIGEPGYEYIATHQLLEIQIAAYRECITKSDLQANTPAYIVRVYNEFLANQDSLTDIQVERAAVLIMIGQSKLVPSSFLRRLATAQSTDGLWHFDEPTTRHGLMPLEHTATLAYYVLSVDHTY